MVYYNFEKVFLLFKRKYKLVPLEFFNKDPYKTLISTVLSSRTKDEVTLLASKRLFKKAPNIKKLSRLDQSDIRKLIYPVGFYKTKANHLKRLAKMVITAFKKTSGDKPEDELNADMSSSFGRIPRQNGGEDVIRNYKSGIPNSLKELIKLPGVGRKTANLVLNRAFGKPAIAVDTHVHKISNILGWVETKTPEQTEAELVKILPQKYWSDINRLFVSLGRQFRSQKKLIEFLKENKLVKQTKNF